MILGVLVLVVSQNHMVLGIKPGASQGEMSFDFYS